MGYSMTKLNEPRVSAKGLKVLHAFVEAGNRELSGADIAERTGILSGTLYPILIRFKSAGWLKDHWEDDDPVELGRPKRRIRAHCCRSGRVPKKSPERRAAGRPRMGVILGILGMIALPLFVRLLGVEIDVHHNPVCHWLVRFAAARLPTEERAAAESEWLAVIEDLRSPTVQLLHSLSLAFSALRIQRAIARESPISPLGKAMVVSQLFVMGMAGGGIADGLLEHGDQVAQILSLHFVISKPVAQIAVFALGVMTGAIAYVNHRLLIRYFGRRAQRRASTTIDE